MSATTARAMELPNASVDVACVGVSASPASTGKYGGKTAVTTVVATGTALSFSIVGGADAAKFQIDANTGALSFLSAPNFEAPHDAGQRFAVERGVQEEDRSIQLGYGGVGVDE